MASATCAAVIFPAVTALSSCAFSACCEAVGGASFDMPAGRLRSDALMPVGTNAGHSTETPTFAPTSRRSWYSVSDSETTPCLPTL